MESKINEIVINGVVYVEKGKENKLADKVDGLEYKIVRTYSAGVFAGYLKSRNGKEAILLNARRFWAWTGAASLSQLAMEGTKTPSTCKFPCEVSKVELTEVIEILDVTEKAQKSINEVPLWKM
jgi:hypothetical protein